MGTINPAVVIDLVGYTPLKFGLKSVASPLNIGDDHWITGGVTFETFTCAQADQWFESCESMTTKAEPPEPTQLTFQPVTVYADWACGPFGMTPEQRQNASELALNCAEEREIEDYFYTSYLTSGVATALNTDLTPVVMPVGVGMLEDALADAQCGEPTIHAPREVGELAAAYHLTYGSGNVLRTALGSPWIFGAGYGNLDPDGVPAPAGVVWLYGTGPMYLAQSGISMTPPTFADALNRSNNEVRWEAQRTSLPLTNSCAVFAVAVTTAASSGGGGGGGLLYPSP